MKSILRLLAVSVISLLQGCGGGEGAFCRVIGTAGGVQSQTAGIQLDESSRAFDGDLSTAAELYSVSGAGSAQFLVSGPPSSAPIAGVLLGLPPGQVTQVRIEALKDGQPVAAGPAGTQSDTSFSCQGACFQRGRDTFFGIPVSGVIDEIRATVQISGTTQDTLVYELCVRG